MQRRKTNINSEPEQHQSTAPAKERGRSSITRPIPSPVVLVVFLLITCLGGWKFLVLIPQQEVIHEHQWKEHEDRLTKGFETRLLSLQAEVEALQESQQQEKEDLQQKGDELKIQYDKQNKLEGQVDYLRNYKTKMHKAIQHVSRNVVLAKFGPGPHRIEMLLAFDPAEPGEGTANRIVLELAPLDDMPHAVYWFLSQVSLELWNGSSFHRNADHVLQAGPHSNFNTPKDSEISDKLFSDAGFESVLFQEYSPNVPHLPLTVGYAGRPGGPDFYISLMDNSENHGPGGQTSYEDTSEADPCFCKVVEGEEAVWRMHGLANEDGDYQGLKHNVAITEMRILQ